MDNIIRIEDLVFEYKREDQLEPVHAVNDVNLEIERGTFTAIIGKNGSGKINSCKKYQCLAASQQRGCLCKGL